MMTGTSIAQLVPIILSPIITRIYSPEDFGVFTLYLTMVLIISTVGSFKYEQAIMLQEDDEQAIAIVKLCGLIALVVSLIAAIFVYFFNIRINAMLTSGDSTISKHWFFMLPFSVFFLSIISVFRLFFNRNKNFLILSKGQVTQSFVTGSGQIVFAKLGIGGLLLSSFLAQISHMLVYGTKFFKKKEYKHILFKQVNYIKFLKRYRGFPFFQAPSALLEVLSAQMPNIILGAYFGPVILGFYALSQRVVRLPIGVIGSSFGEVFRQAASSEYIESGDVRELFIRTLKKLTIVSVLPFLILFVFAPDLFSLVFGEQWRHAGNIIRIMAPMIWLSFIVGPLSVMFFIAEKQRMDFIMQVFLVLTSGLALICGYYLYDSAEISLALFSVVYCIKYCVELFLSYSYCIKEAK